MTGYTGAAEAPTKIRDQQVVAPEDVRNVLGVDVQVLSRAQAIAEIADRLRSGRHERYAFLNANGANIAYKDEVYRQTFGRFRVLADGIGVDIASRALYGATFPDNLNGTDFIPDLLDALDTKISVALLGAQPGVAEEAAEKLRSRFPRHAFDVIDNGYMDDVRQSLAIKRLSETRPDLLLVAMGNPVQEFWIDRHCTQDHATVVMGVGALFDFLAGRMPRAPKPWIDLRIEWLYRLSLEPRRMWRRYVLGNPAFLFRVLKQKLAQKKTTPTDSGNGS